MREYPVKITEKALCDMNALMILSLLKNEKRLTIERIAEMTHLAEGKLLGAIENLIGDGFVEKHLGLV